MTQNEVYEYLRKLRNVEISTPCPNCSATKLEYETETHDPDCGTWTLENIGISCTKCNLIISFWINLSAYDIQSFAELDSVVEKLNNLVKRV